ncbi:lipopolysaccharide biosynthesis protein [Pseudoalteromonas tunicata]|uniref:lipopolysaccharide biosynthesis protein n=1 Tax=Pseudoalteromonas tunicata TaxID=314281 RepID=UPI00273FF0DA|nr:oligosaccharide flippase family protein [Pseudoalteromonas tunicata]MDP4985550.1 oligosaccharide flippase family protein [Pseudoalteromonas tunicata]
MKQLKEMLLYAMAVFMLKGLGFIMMPLVTRFLSQEQYGELNVLVSMAAMVSLVLTLGLGEALFRFTGQSSQQDTVMRQCLRLSLLSSGGFLCLSILFIEPLLALLPVSLAALDVQLLMINLAAGALLTVPYCYFRLTKQAGAFFMLSVGQGVLQTGLSVWFLYQGLAVRGLMLSGAIASVAIMVVTLVYFRHYWFGARMAFNRTHYQYCFFIVCSSLAVYGLSGAENWLVAAALGKAQLALFFAAAQFGLMISVAFEPFRMWWFAKRFAFEQNNSDLGAHYAVLGVQIGMLLALLMLIIAPWLMGWLLPAHFAPSLVYIPWFCLIMVARFHADLLNLGCFLKKSASVAMIINAVCAAILLPFGYWSLGELGMMGLIWVMVGVHLLRAILFLVVSQSLTPLAYPFKSLVGSWLIFLTAFYFTITVIDERTLTEGFPANYVLLLGVLVVLKMALLVLGYMRILGRFYRAPAIEIKEVTL